MVNYEPNKEGRKLVRRAKLNFDFSTRIAKNMPAENAALTLIRREELPKPLEDTSDWENEEPGNNKADEAGTKSKPMAKEIILANVSCLLKLFPRFSLTRFKRLVEILIFSDLRR